MKTSLKNLFLLHALIASLGLMLAGRLTAQTFTTLHSFTAAYAATSGRFPPYTNSDGTHPEARLLLSGNTLYGTASGGGSAANGTVFAINTDGTGFTTLHGFTAIANGLNIETNSDGGYPVAGLILSGNTLYGTAGIGGSAADGTVFAVNTDGTGFRTLHSFTATDPNTYTNSDGANPICALILSGNTLYGTAYQGGSAGNGTVFSLLLPPQLTITRIGTNVVLTWPTNYAGFALQSTTNLLSPSSWITNSAPPVVVNGQNTVTYPISGAQQFYRLSQ